MLLLACILLGAAIVLMLCFLIATANPPAKAQYKIKMRDLNTGTYFVETVYCVSKDEARGLAISAAAKRGTLAAVVNYSFDAEA